MSTCCHSPLRRMAAVVVIAVCAVAGGLATLNGGHGVAAAIFATVFFGLLGGLLVFAVWMQGQADDLRARHEQRLPRQEECLSRPPGRLAFWDGE